MADKQILDTPLEGHHETNLENYTASMGRRFANYLIDTVVIIVLAIIVAVFAGGYDNPLLIDAYVIGIQLIYFVVCESAFGQTLGKVITKTEVLTLDGARPPVLTIVGRTLCRYIPFEPFSLLGGGPGWHDTISKTRVVDKI
jgi:uncharacterized RDD family membrane protein YckC